MLLENNLTQRRAPKHVETLSIVATPKMRHQSHSELGSTLEQPSSMRLSVAAWARPWTDENTSPV